MSSERNRSKNTFARECMVMALKKLLSQKKLEEITVSELTEVAGVSRTTFYRNYNSIESILADYFERYPFGVASESSYDSENFTLEGRIYDSLMFLKREQSLINSMLKYGFDRLLYENYKNLIHGLCKDRAYEIGFRSEYELNAFTGIYYALCLEWMKNGMQESIEKMVDICYEIIHKFYIDDDEAFPERDNVYRPKFKG